MLNGIFWRLNTGVPWRDLPDRYGPWQTVYDRFNKLRTSGLLDRILQRLQLRLNQEGLIDSELFCIDGSNVRAARAAAGASKKNRPPGEPEDHALGRSRGGFGTKIHLVSDGKGLPLAAEVTAGQRHESTQCEQVLDQVHIPNGRGRPLSTDPTCGGQGLQLSSYPALVAAAWDQGRYPASQGPTPRGRSRAVRAGDLQTSGGGRAVCGLAEGEPSSGDPLRQTCSQLPGDGEAGDDSKLPPPTYTRK